MLKQRTDLKSLLCKWDFKVWSISNDDYTNCVIIMFESLGLVQEYDIDLAKLKQFGKTLQKNYYDNPYHNFMHAMDVAQMCYLFMTKSKVRHYLRKHEMLVLLVSAFCHDLCHPGLNNPFQINAKTDLALLYNDMSVLENHHCCQTFKILKEEKNNILSTLSGHEHKGLPL